MIDLRYLFPALTGNSFGFVLGATKAIFCAVVFFRLLLALPAAAIGKRHGLARSWQLTRGNLFAMALILLASFLPQVAFGFVVLLAFGTNIFDVAHGPFAEALYVFDAVGRALSALGTMIFAVTLSVSYKALMAEAERDGGDTLAVAGA
jgi:hypothetical protein